MIFWQFILEISVFFVWVVSVSKTRNRKQIFSDKIVLINNRFFNQIFFPDFNEKY